MPIDDFTMVIPTYNRPRMLADALRHYTTCGDFSIIVVDSSRDDVQEQNVASIMACSGNVRHVRYPSTMSVSDKFFTLPGLIDTPYAMYAADDDIALLGGVFASLRFLRANTDFVACHGIYYGGRQSAPDTLAVTTEYATISIDSPDPLERLFALALRYQAVTYSVQRREAILAARPPLDVATPHFWELYHAFALVAQGKIAALGVPYMMRNAQLGFQPEFMGDGNNWLLKDSAAMSVAYEQFRAKVAPLLAQHAHKRSVDHLIDLVYSVFAARNFHFSEILRVLEADGDLRPGSAALLTAVSAQPNAARELTDDVKPVLAQFIVAGWPIFG